MERSDSGSGPMQHVELVNMTDVIAALQGPKMTQEEIVEWLRALPNLVPPITEFFSIGKGKGGRIMLRPEDAERVKSLDRADLFHSRQRVRRIREEAAAVPPVLVQNNAQTHALLTRIANMEERVDTLESMVLEESGRADALHKAVQEITATYLKLRAEVDPKANLPEPPPLPPRYRYKVVIGGGSDHLIDVIRRRFPDLKVIHFGQEDNAINTNKRTMPNADLIVALTDQISHRLWDAFERAYGKERIYKARASMSSLEPFLVLWIMERDKEKKE